MTYDSLFIGAVRLHFIYTSRFCTLINVLENPFSNRILRNNKFLLNEFDNYLTYLLINVFSIVPTTGCDVLSNEGICYSYFTDTGISWQDARLECVSRGYDLATITSSTEYTLLYNLATSGTRCWIGLNDIDTEGTFLWADGSSSSYRSWSSSQPNNFGGNQDCVETFGSQYWNDAGCTVNQNCYFCGSIGE